ncbi:MAG: signal peptidase II [Planctomycetaceae bacterium]
MTRVPGSRTLVFCLIAGTGLFWDLFSKTVVFDDLGYTENGRVVEFGRHKIFDRPPGIEGSSVPYIRGWTTFRLFTSFNHGALWGVGQGYSWAFAALSVVAVAGIIYWLFVRKAARSLWLTVALAFILAGTLGNLYDRAGLHGCVDLTGARLYAVRDFLLFTFGGFPWPVFNFADVYLVTGATMLVLQSFRADAHSTTPLQSTPAAATTSSEPPQP